LWFDRHHVQPDVVAEIEDSAVVKVFGKGGIGLFASPIAIEKDVVDQFNVERLGLLDGVIERFMRSQLSDGSHILWCGRLRRRRGSVCSVERALSFRFAVCDRRVSKAGVA
jgi:hypothetical protein